MNNDFVLPILTLLLGGGVTGAILNLVKASNEKKKAPAERDAIVVTSAESAVAIMQKVLDTTNTQLKVKEEEVEDLTKRLTMVKNELKELRERCGELESLLEVVIGQQKANKDASGRG